MDLLNTVSCLLLTEIRVHSSIAVGLFGVLFTPHSLVRSASFRTHGRYSRNLNGFPTFPIYTCWQNWGVQTLTVVFNEQSNRPKNRTISH